MAEGPRSVLHAVDMRSICSRRPQVAERWFVSAGLSPLFGRGQLQCECAYGDSFSQGGTFFWAGRGTELRDRDGADIILYIGKSEREELERQ